MSCLLPLHNLIRKIQNRELGPVLFIRDEKVFRNEKLPIKLYLENLIMYSKPFDVIDKTGLVRRLLKSENIHSEHFNNTYTSAKKIPSFVDFFEINMTDFEQDNPHLYRTFNDFFIRELSAGKRPIAGFLDDTVVICPADSRVTVYKTLTEAHRLFIKGKKFSFSNLVGKNADESDKDKVNYIKTIFSNSCPMANFRLAPMDYHHFHSPVSGVITHMYHIPGEYFTVEPKALKSEVDVLGENTRSIVCIKTEKHGNVLFIPIGAEAVGTVKMLKKENDRIEKGDELGFFEYGGSDVVILFENNVKWDNDLVQVSKDGIETLCKVNEQIGLFDGDINVFEVDLFA